MIMNHIVVIAAISITACLVVIKGELLDSIMSDMVLTLEFSMNTGRTKPVGRN